MTPDTLQTIVLLILCFGVANGKNVTYDWTLQASVGETLSPDCMNAKELRRSMFLANNTFPGPVIEAEEGDTITVRINNQNPTVSASIHFHGIHQMGTPYSDGAAFVSQCALGPLQSQEYTFEAYPPGTHYWHDHTSYNLADGLSGPIVIRPKKPDPFAYDEERIIFLQDWFIETGMQQLDGLTSWPFVWIGNPNSLLINGKGIAPECQVGGVNFNSTIFCLPSCLGDPLALVSSINVTTGKTYRFRIINSGQLMMTNFAIAGHNLTVVQADGTNVEPFTVYSLDITPGQRYDVLVVADKQGGSFMIRTTARERNIGLVNGTAILNYDGDGIKFPIFPPEQPVWNDTAFGINQDQSLKTLNASSYPTFEALSATNITRIVSVGTQNQYVVDGKIQFLRWAMNNVSNVHGSTPLIGLAVEASRKLGAWPADIEHTMDLPSDIPYVWDWTMKVNETGGPNGTLGYMAESVILLQEGEVVEIVLQNARALNGVAEFHPWHIHGHSFWVVGQGEGNYDAETDVAKYNLDNPILRDTVILQPLGWVALRFVANNPGAWFFHCHIMSHHVMGMGFSLIVQPDSLGALPPSVMVCDDQGLISSSTNETGQTGGSGNGTSSAIFRSSPLSSAMVTLCTAIATFSFWYL